VNLIASGKVSLHSDLIGEAISISADVVAIDGFSIHQSRNMGRPAVSVEKGCAAFANCKLKGIGNSTVVARGTSQLLLAACVVKGTTGSCMSSLDGSSVVADQTVFASSRSDAVKLRDGSITVLRRCTLRDNTRGGLSAGGRSQLLIDSSLFVDSEIDLSTDSVTVIVGSTFERKGIIAGKATRSVITDSKFIKSVLDCRENSDVRTVHNTFDSASLVIWGDSRVKSEGDAFQGDVASAIGVSEKATLVVVNAQISGVTGNGVVCYNESRVELQAATIQEIGGSGVMAHSGARVVVNDGEIADAKGFGIVTADTAETTLARVVVTRAGATGVEVTRSAQFHADDIKVTKSGKVGLGVFKSSATVNRSEFIGNGYSGLHLVTAAASVIGCKVENNTKGGLVAVQSSKVKLRATDFRGNDSASVYADQKSSVDVDHSLFENSYVGVSIAGQSQITDSTFTKHQAVAVQAAGSVAVDRCSISGEPIGIALGEGGQLKVDGSLFEDNGVHVEATVRGSVTLANSSFVAATGASAVHAANASLTVQSCKFERNPIAIVSEGETNVADSMFSANAKCAVVFSGKARGEVKSSSFEGNGQCALHCLEGTPKILRNHVKGHEKFGIYIFPKCIPVVEGNEFESNGIANLWRQ
jgi:hypothetical protein